MSDSIWMDRIRAVKLLTWFKLVLLFLIMGALYGGVIAKLVRDWFTDDNYSHGILVPFISLYLVWERRESLAKLHPQSHWFGLLLIVSSQVLLVLGLIGVELFLTRFSLLLLITGLVLNFGGVNFLKQLLFPLCILILMIPIPAIIFNQISFQLQIIASKIAGLLLQVLQVPMLREGNVIYLANSTLEVAEACSGIRSLVSLITLGVVFSYFRHENFWERFLITCSTIPVAVLTNSIRVTGTGLLHFWGYHHLAEGFFHNFAGWVVFTSALLLLMIESYTLKGLGNFLSRFKKKWKENEECFSNQR